MLRQKHQFNHFYFSSVDRMGQVTLQSDQSKYAEGYLLKVLIERQVSDGMKN